MDFKEAEDSATTARMDSPLLTEEADLVVTDHRPAALAARPEVVPADMAHQEGVSVEVVGIATTSSETEAQGDTMTGTPSGLAIRVQSPGVIRKPRGCGEMDDVQGDYTYCFVFRALDLSEVHGTFCVSILL